jgi:hypothetical protein
MPPVSADSRLLRFFAAANAANALIVFRPSIMSEQASPGRRAFDVRSPRERDL